MAGRLKSTGAALREMQTTVARQFHLVNLSCQMLEAVSGHRVKFTLLIRISQVQTGLTSTLDVESQDKLKPNLRSILSC